MRKRHSFSAFFLALVLVTSLAGPCLASQDMAVAATAAILVDADYDQVLWEYQADALRYPASITKVMTGLLTVEAVDSGALGLDDMVELGSELYVGIGSGGSSVGLKIGEILSVRDLLYCALMPSANEACNGLAMAVAGSIQAFVVRMNQRAQELGMTGTHFANSHGYHDDNHYTTARDIARMCQEAMKHPEFRKVVSSTSYTVPDTYNAAGERVHASFTVHDTNALISNLRTGRSDLLYQYAVGIKTGSTPEAGYCLASAAEKKGRTMIAVVLGGNYWKSGGVFVEDNYFSESKRLLEYGFNAFERKTILNEIEPIATLPVELCAQQNYVTVQPAASLEATLLKTLDPAEFGREVVLPEGPLVAPIQKGDVLGSITVTYGGQTYGTVDLIASTSLAYSQRLYILSRIRYWLSQLWVKLALLGLVLLFLFLALRRALLGPRSGYKSNRRPTGYRGRRRQ